MKLETLNSKMTAETLPTARRVDKKEISNARLGDEISWPPQVSGATIRLCAGQMIFGEGDKVKHFYRVMTGKVRLCKMRCNGRRQIIDFLIPGDLFGLEFGAEYPFNGEAIGEAVLERYSFQQIEQLSDERLDIRRHLMMLLQRNLSAIQCHMVMLGTETAKERVAAFLASFAARLDIINGGILDLGMGRQDIADYVGLALETVCRELGGLQREGLIEVLDRRRVAICDAAALQAIAEGRE